MRYISKTINISNFKSYIDSLIPACKDNQAIDIREKKYQERLNATSNYSMCPFTVKVTINTTDLKVIRYWAWHTLHEIYLFFLENKDYCIEPTEKDDFLQWLGGTKENLYNNFDVLRDSIIDFVKTGYNTKNSLIQFEIIDNLTPFGGCQEPINYKCSDDKNVENIECFTNISIPLNITNTIDNVGLLDNLPEDWQEKTQYGEGELCFYDEKDWRLKTKDKLDYVNALNKYETCVNGYTWDDLYKESVFGNLYYDNDEEAYVSLTGETPWIRNIEYEMSGRTINGINIDGKDFASFLGENYLYSGEEIYYAYKNSLFKPNPTNKDMSDVYDIIKSDTPFIIYDNEVIPIQYYHVIKNFNCTNVCVIKKETCNYPYIEYGGEIIYGYEEKVNNAELCDGTEKESEFHFEYGGVTWHTEKKYGMVLNGTFIDMEGKNIYSEGYKIDSSLYSRKYYNILATNTYYVTLNGKVYVILGGDLELKDYISTNNISDPYLNPVDIYGENFNKTNEFDFATTEAPGTIENSPINQKTGYYIDIKENKLYLCKPYSIELLNYVGGTCESHLSMFISGSGIFDELGAKLDGIVLPSAKYNKEPNEIDKPVPNGNGLIRPIPNKSLSLKYIPNTVKYIEKVSEKNTERNVLYFGNILTDIKFYIEINDSLLSIDDFVTDSFWDDFTTGEKLDYIFEEIGVKTTIDTNDNYKYVYSLNKLSETPNLIDINEIINSYDGKIKCKFKYHLGTFINLDKITGKYSLVTDKNLHKGVEYEETYTLNRNLVKYSKSVNDIYNVYTYTLNPDKTIPIGGDFETFVPMATFKMEIPIYNISNDGKYVELYDKTKYGNNEDQLDPNKNFISVPVIHRDFNNGIASQEKVSGNIYIDRGVSSSFEKHLKLQEISTMNDLETYSNGGFFNIVTDA